MVDRAESLVPATLRYSFVKGLQDLRQLEVANLPEGARAIMQDGYAQFSAYAMGAPGVAEFLFTRQTLQNPFTFGNGVNATGNAILAKDGSSMWVRIPQVFSVALNGTTPVVVDDVVNQANATVLTPTNVMASVIRVGSSAGGGHISVTAGNLSATAQQLNVVSDNAADNAQLILLVWPIFGQR